MSDENKQSNVILNDEEKKLLLDHNYDGIEEFDYPLPSWWKATFYGGIYFAVIYLLFYHVFDAGKSLRQEFEEDMAKIEQIRSESQGTLGFDEKEYKAWVTTADAMSKGKEVWFEYCTACHKDQGEGDIGPNLTDKHWINLKKVTAQGVYEIIRDGREEQGMPIWSEVLEKEEMYAVTEYVMSQVVNKNVPGKEPQGEAVE